MKTNVRVHQITLKNIKNVEYGVLTFQDGNLVSSHGAGILGIFGQNGSGKTAALDSLQLIKTLISGEILDPFSSYLVNLETKTASIEFVFDVSLIDITYQVRYQVDLRHASKGRLIITNEKFDYRFFSINKHWRSILKSQTYQHHNRISKGKHFIHLPHSHNLNRSLIFNPLFVDSFNEQMNEIEKDLINVIRDYAQNHILMINNFTNRDFRTKDAFPLIYYVAQNGYRNQVMRIKYGLNYLNEEDFNLFTVIVEKISQLLIKIIPGIALSYHHERKGEEHVIELITLREGIKLPLKYESIGVKKFVLVLGALISMYNAPDVLVAIDEIDTGIFEYLLGEIFVILKEEGRGQLLFTSHNLRPLEILNPYQLVFTSQSAKNRYITLKNQPEENLRDLYLRSIEVGGLKENMYRSTDQFEISRAFRLAGPRQ